MIAILKYNAGNIRSVQNALDREGIDWLVTDNDKELSGADKVIIPGVGHAGSAMKHLRERGLDNVIRSLVQPVLGICLGLQLLCRSSDEDDTECLGIFNVHVNKFPPAGIIPHMGWNSFTRIEGELFNSISADYDMYYVHSYYAGISEDTIAECEYMVPFSAAMKRNNFYATQFHPEKSALAGGKILKNFLSL